MSLSRLVVGPLRRSRGQQGYVLATVIALLGLIAIVGTALFTMTITAMKVTQAFSNSLDEVSASDSAIDLVVSDFQRFSSMPTECDDLDADAPDSSRTIEFPDRDPIDITVDCAGVSKASPDSRLLTLKATPDGKTTPLALAKIRILDQHNAEKRPGFRLQICEWQLGEHVHDADWNSAWDDGVNSGDPDPGCT